MFKPKHMELGQASVMYAQAKAENTNNTSNSTLLDNAYEVADSSEEDDSASDSGREDDSASDSGKEDDPASDGSADATKKDVKADEDTQDDVPTREETMGPEMLANGDAAPKEEYKGEFVFSNQTGDVSDGGRGTATDIPGGTQALDVPVANRKPSNYNIPGWQEEDGKYWYETAQRTYYASGWKSIDSQNYYFDDEGYMATGWQNIGGKSCYFNEYGVYQPDAECKAIAMTFDDGPSEHTSRLLDVLEANNAKATFFMVGNQAENFPDVVARGHSLGMQMGNHTYDHTYLSKVDLPTMLNKFKLCDDVLKNICGEEASVYRSPGGIENEGYRASIDRPLILWSVDTLDWKTRDVQSNIGSVLGKVADGDIVLMHDLYETTVESCETIIPQLVADGFQLVTVEELARMHGVELKPGVDYFDFHSN